MADGHDTYASHSCVLFLLLLFFSCSFLTSSLCLRHCSSSIHHILSRRGLEGGVWKGIYMDCFVCVRERFWSFIVCSVRVLVLVFSLSWLCFVRQIKASILTTTKFPNETWFFSDKRSGTDPENQ